MSMRAGSLIQLPPNNTQTKKGQISGTVYELDTKTPIAYASIKVLKASKDSTLVEGTSTKEDGSFVLNPTVGNYLLEVSFVGYHKKHLGIKLDSKNMTIKLDSIFLKDNAIALREAEVVAKLPAMQVKGDTIEFNAGAYNSDGSSVLKDLIKQIPGLELDDKGQLKANGKPITKILVDGKEYFGNDISMALTSLPANMITKLQLFEKQSEEAKATGIKDIDPEQVLNLGVKEEFKRSTFGDIKSGIGNKGRHTNRFNTNKMHGDNQYTLLGDINNINDSEYRYGTDFDNNINKSIGANFNIQQSEKITINGSAKYNNYKTRDEYRSDSYSSVLKQLSKSEGKSISKRQGMDWNATVDWKPDSLTTVYLRTDMGYNDGRNISLSKDSAHIRDKSTTLTEGVRNSKSDGIRISNSLMLARKLNNKGRNISVNLSQSYNKDKSSGTNLSTTTYDLQKPEVLDQINKNNNTSTNYSLSARYVEPLGKDNRIYASYSISWNDGDSFGDVQRLDSITHEYKLDRNYSRNTDSYSRRQNIRLGFQRTQEKYDFNVSFAVDPTHITNKSYLPDTIFDDQKQDVVNFSPSGRFTWKIDKNTFFDFDYRGSTQHPTVSQLSTDVKEHNLTSKTVGNPNLKPTFHNHFGVNYRKSDYESGRFLSAAINYMHSMNAIVTTRNVDENSNTTTSYRNVNGGNSAYGYVTYNMPFKDQKINVGGFFNIYQSKSIAYINDKKNTLNSVSISPSVYARVNLSWIETNLNVSLSHRISHNNLSEKKRSDNTDYRLSNTLKIKLPLDFAIESDLTFTYRTGLGEEVKKSETMWNLAASKLFLKEKRGTLKFEFYDVLNDYRQQENSISGDDYNNYWRAAVNNYFVVSFAYRFNFT